MNNIKQLFIKIKGCCEAIRDFVKAFKELAVAFVDAGVGGIVNAIHSAFLTDIYAASMFSNRTTDIETAKNLSGMTLPDKMDSDNTSGCFDKADMEYLMIGGTSETENQKLTFTFLMCIRFLFNVVPVLMDSLVKSVYTSLSEIPIVGVFIAIIVVIIWTIVETYVDMQILINIKSAVPFIKFDYIYMSADGIDKLLDKISEKEGFDDFKKQIEQVFNETNESIKEISNGNESESGNNISQISDLIEVDYTGHLYFCFVFIGSNTLIKRMANLIEADAKRNNNDNSFSLKESYTYLRVATKADYLPVMPTFNIPAVNGSGIPVSTIDYCGY